MTSRTGVCAAWATESDLQGDCRGIEFEETLATSRLLMASNILWSLTGKRWPGVCTDIVRPVLTDGCWFLYGDRVEVSLPRRRGARVAREIRLPGFPVVSVSSVKIDGVVLAAARYDIVDDRYLMYVPETPTAERQGWPTDNDLTLATTEVGTWEVTYTYGTSPDEGGKVAAAALACELMLAADPERRGKCRLPRRVQSVTRQGVTMAVLDNLTDLFDKGLTGIPEVDLWLTSIDKGRRRRSAAVVDPLAPRKFYRGR